MTSEGEAEAAAESGPGSTPAPAAAVREEVSGGGDTRPGSGRGGPGGAKAAPPRDRAAGSGASMGRNLGTAAGGECPGRGCLRSGGSPNTCSRDAGTAARRRGAMARRACSAGAAGGAPGRRGSCSQATAGFRVLPTGPRRPALCGLPGSGRRLGSSAGGSAPKKCSAGEGCLGCGSLTK